MPVIKTLLKNFLSASGLLLPLKRLPFRFKHDTIDRYLNEETRGIKHVTFRSFDEYQQYKRNNIAAIKSRDNITQSIIDKHDSTFVIKAESFLKTNQKAYYRVDIAQQQNEKTINIRETCIDLELELNNRVRATLYAILSVFPKQRLISSDVYLTEAVTPLYNWFNKKTNGLVGSEYIDHHLVSGTVVKGIMHQNITAMSFPDNSFDLGVCLEVLEHIPNYLDALSELARVTRNGGSMFISVPFIEHSEQTILRAELLTDGTIVHHLPPEYHGDPVNPNGGILCFRHFGWDFIADLKKAGFADVKVHMVWSAENLIIGQPVMIMEAVK